MFWLLILFICIMYFVHYRAGSRFHQLSKKLPTGFVRWPFIGHAYMFTGGKEGIMNGLKKLGMDAVNRGGLATFTIGNNFVALVADPISAELLLKNCLEKHEVATKAIQFFIGNGSLYAPVPAWRARRKLLAPTFSLKRLNRFVDVFASQSAVLVQQLRPMVGKGTFPVWKYLTTYTFDAVCETTLGVRLNAQENPNHPYLEALEKTTDLIAQRTIKPWQHPDWLYRLLPSYKEADKCKRAMNDFIDEIITSKRKEIEEKQRKPEYAPKTDDYLGFQSLLEMLLETSLKVPGFSDVELREEAVVMSAAGTDTSATGACFALLMLSRHPEVQEKVAEELQQVLGSGDNPVIAADLPQLKYLEAVVKETLRLYPPVPVIVRTTTKDIELQSDIIFPKGTGIMVSIWAVHRNPRYWGSDVEEFRPERFLKPLVHPDQFIPFSYGLRNCLGYQYAMMSMKTVLATVLRQYRVLPPAGTDPKTLNEPIRVNYDIMMKAVDKFQVQLEKRSWETDRHRVAGK